MITWLIWTPISSVPKKADKLNLSLSIEENPFEYIVHEMSSILSQGQ